MSQPWQGARRKSRRSEHDQRLRWAAREIRRRTMIAGAVGELGAGVTHEAVAQHTGIPLGFLRWAYPTVDDLQAGREPSERR